MPIFGPNAQPLKGIPSQVGTIFYIGRKWQAKPYRRKAGGRIVSARSGGKDPTIRRGFWMREKQRRRRAEARLRYLSLVEGLARPSYRQGAQRTP